MSIALGGDGTILRLVHEFPDLEAPLLGINLGNLGFMTDVPLSELLPSLEDLLAGNYQIEERLMIEGETQRNERFFAVNDIVIHRAKNPSLIDLSINVDDDYLNTFSADGIIVSTSNGSTAYCLSAGGPIVAPTLDALIIAPISPHTISNRPIVLLPKQKIDICCLSPHHSVEISYDGFAHYTLGAGEVLSIFLSSKRFKMLRLHRTKYFATVRTKLGWTGQVRYNSLNQ